MHSSRSVVRAPRSPPRDKARKNPPKAARGAECLPRSTAPGSSFPWSQTVRAARPTEQPSLRGKAPAGVTEAGSRIRGGWNRRPRHPPPGRGCSTGQLVRHPRRARAPPSPAARARARPRAAEGEGRPRARPLLRRPNFPQLPQLSCALTVRLPGLPRGPSRSSSAPWRRRRTIGDRSLGGGWVEEQAPRCRPTPNT